MYGELWLHDSIDAVHSRTEKQFSVEVLSLFFFNNIIAQKWFAGSATLPLTFLVHKCVYFSYKNFTLKRKLCDHQSRHSTPEFQLYVIF